VKINGVLLVNTEHRRKVGAPSRIEYGQKMKALAVYLSVVGLVGVKEALIYAVL
jgi:preprotein translocase subunit Sss1